MDKRQKELNSTGPIMQKRDVYNLERKLREMCRRKEQERVDFLTKEVNHE